MGYKTAYALSLFQQFLCALMKPDCFTTRLCGFVADALEIMSYTNQDKLGDLRQ